MKKDCGCDRSQSTPPDMYLMAASPQSASTCGTGEANRDASQNCTKTDSSYDITIGAYTIPAQNTSAPLQVCNGSIYSVGQWIQFVIDGSTLQIMSIVGNALTLRNGCPNNAGIFGNSNPGTVINSGAAIVVVGEPECLTDTQKDEQTKGLFARLKSLCMPALEQEASSTAEMQIVAFKRADSGDSSFEKCIRRVKGFWIKGSSLFIKPISQAPKTGETGGEDWRNIVRHKTTGEIRELLNPFEDTSLLPGEKYVLMVTSTGQKLVGPAYVFVPVQENLYKNHNGDMTDESLWVNIPNGTPLTQTINLSIASINNLNIQGAKFYAMINVNLGVDQPAGYQHTAKLEINGVIKGMSSCKGGPFMNTISLIVEIDKNNKNFELKVTTDGSVGTPKCHVSVDLTGVQL